MVHNPAPFVFCTVVVLCTVFLMVMIIRIVRRRTTPLPRVGMFFTLIAILVLLLVSVGMVELAYFHLTGELPPVLIVSSLLLRLAS